MKHVRGSLNHWVSHSSQKYLRGKSFALTGVPHGLVDLEGQSQVICQTGSAIHRPPKTVQSFWCSQFAQNEYQAPSLEEGMLTIDRGIATFSGGHLDAKGRLVTTYLSPPDGKLHDEHELFHFRFSSILPKITVVDHPIISLTAAWQGAFYHWMYQILPRLGLVEWNYPVYVDQRHRFQRECMELMGLQTQVIDVVEYPAVRASKVFVPEPRQDITPRARDFLRAQFLPHVTDSKKRRLYISRKDAATRRIENEEEILPILERFGFETATLSDKSFVEQVTLFKGAEMVVAPHGAGLSHLVFCDPGTPVLELMHASYLNACYWLVCTTCDLPYHSLIDWGETHTEDPNLRVNPDELIQTLERMEYDRSHR